MTSRKHISADQAPSSLLSSRVAIRIVRQAAGHAPPALKERLEEEWLADLAVRQTALSRLRFALGVLWARQVIAFDPAAFGVTEARATTAQVAIAALAPQHGAGFSRRTVVLLLIIGLHFAVLSAVLSGMTLKTMAAPPGSFQTGFIEEPHRTDAPPPLRSPRFVHSTIIDIPVDPLVQVPTTSETTTDPVTDPPAPPDPAPTYPAVTRLSGGPGAGFPSTDDFYPVGSIRLGESGISTVRVCTDNRGRLMTAPTIAVTSGSARIDAGALALARAGSGHYRSTLENGQPVDSCYEFRIRFALKQ
jgi:hypothetical protein